MGFACFEFSINGILLKVIFCILHILLNLVVDCSLLWEFATVYIPILLRMDIRLASGLRVL